MILTTAGVAKEIRRGPPAVGWSENGPNRQRCLLEQKGVLQEDIRYGDECRPTVH